MAKPLLAQLSRTTSRRSFFRTAGTAAGGLAAAMAVGTDDAQSAPVSRARLTPDRVRDATRFAWVWKFGEDGDPYYVRNVLARHHMGIMFKTHDGTGWMRDLNIWRDDRQAHERISRIATFFEDGGVPFHTWSVIKGKDPKREAEMADIVLSTGARSLVLDLESYEGFWEGTPDDAIAFGKELRQLRRNPAISLTVDQRPWEVRELPMAEFTSFANEVLPQTYWGMFTSKGNVTRFAEAGYDPGDAGVTPRFLIDATMDVLNPFGLPIAPIGDGTVSDHLAWSEFLAACSAHRTERISVWRLGVTSPEVLALMQGLRKSHALPLVPSLHPLLEGAPEVDLFGD